MSTLQTLATATVFDYLYDSAGLPLANREITVQLSYNKASYKSPVVSVPNIPIRVTTDSNGYWEAKVVRNTDLNPANTVYQVHGAGQSFDVSVPAGAGPFQASAIATGQLPALVGGFNATGPGTVTGSLVVTGTLSASNATVIATSGVLYALNQLQLGSPAAQILARSSQGLDFPSPGIVAFDRVGTGFTTATRQWGEAVLFGAGSDLGQWQMSFWDSALAPKHAWVMGLGVDADDSLQWATVTGQSVKMRLRYDDGSLYSLTRVSPVQAGAASLTPNAATYTIWQQTLNQNITITAPASPVKGQLLGIIFIHDGTGNNYTFTWNAVFKLSGPVSSSTANARVIWWFLYDGALWVQISQGTAV